MLKYLQNIRNWFTYRFWFRSNSTSHFVKHGQKICLLIKFSTGCQASLKCKKGWLATSSSALWKLFQILSFRISSSKLEQLKSCSGKSKRVNTLKSMWHMSSVQIHVGPYPNTYFLENRQTWCLPVEYYKRRTPWSSLPLLKNSKVLTCIAGGRPNLNLR